MYMLINGFNTNTIPNCQLIDAGEVKAAEPRRVESTTIYGANGRFDVLDDAYDGYERSLTFLVKRLGDIARLVELFSVERNALIFWYQTDSLYYADYLESTYQPRGLHYWEVVVKLYMHPFRYAKGVDDVVLAGAGAVVNPGTVYAEPIIVVEGNGRATLTIGSQVMELELTGRATIDCRHQQQKILDRNGNVRNTIRKRGPFFELAVGRSGVVTSGGITKVTITGNWRYRI